MDQISSPFGSATVSKSAPRSAVLMLFTLAILLNVTSMRKVFAKESHTAAAAILVAADDDKDDGKKDDEDDDAKFKQPVRVGDLIGRNVIAPVESQTLLGHITKIVRHEDDVTIVMTYGGHFGFGTHLVCVAADSLALTGYALQAKDISLEDLDKLPVCDGSSDAPLDPNASIKMNVAKPAH